MNTETQMLALEAEVRDLRAAFEYEARVVEAQTLDLKALGKGRRKILVEQVERMREIAKGNDRPMRHAVHSRPRGGR